MLLFSVGAGAVSPISHDRRGVRPSPAVLAAIGVSAAVHAGLGLYLYTHKFMVQTPATTPDSVMTVSTVVLQPPQAPPKPPPATKPADVHPRQADRPIDAPQPPDFAPLKPVAPGDLAKTDPTPEIKSPPAPPAGPKTIVQPHWLSLPTADELMDAYPARALDLGLTGAVTLSCVVAASGTVHDCAVVSETPKDMGFGAAGLKLQRYFRMTPKTEDGQPVEGGVVRVAIRFTLAD